MRIVIVQPLAALILLGAILSAWGMWRLSANWSDYPQCDVEETRSETGIATLICIAAAGLFVLSAVEAYVKPDMSWDGQAYHIPAIHFWSLGGYVQPVIHDKALGLEGIEPWTKTLTHILNAFPMGIETFAFVLVRASANSHLVNMPNLFYVPMGVLSIAFLTRILGVGPRLSLASGAMFVILPVTIQQAGTALVDTGFAACVLSLFAGLAHYCRRFRQGDLPRSFAVPLGCSLGMTLGAKLSGFLVAGMAGVLLLGFSLLISHSRSRRCPDMSSAEAQNPRFGVRVCLFLSATIIIACAVGGYWHTRNFIITGNPVWPLKVSVAGYELFPSDKVVDRALSHEKYSARKLWLQGGIGSEPTQWPKSILDHSNWHGGMGYLWLLGCLPAIFLQLGVSTMALIRRNRAPSRPAWPGEHVWILLAICLAMFFVLPGTGRARYVYWFCGLGLPAFFWVVHRVFVKANGANLGWRLFVRSWVLACLVVGVFEGVYCAAWWSTRSYAWVTGHQWPDFAHAPVRSLSSLYWYDPVGYNVPSLSATVFDEILTNQDAVALHRTFNPPLGRLLVGQLSSPLGRRPVYFVGREVLNDSSALVRQVRKHRIRYLILEHSFGTPESAVAVAEKTYEVPPYFWVLEFRPEEEGHAACDRTP